ncbi:hypothetical protein LIA77_11013 [Sarocladium implicatum]|nr:hypothetical protein LIA77_11013 [Sarocladium implicatum]
MASPWKPRLMVQMCPLRMRTAVARCGYFLVFPLLYYLFYNCLGDTAYPPIAQVAITVCFLAYHIIGPVLIYTYESWYNPYAFAPELLGKASCVEEAELLDANRRALRWYWGEGPINPGTWYERMPPGTGYRESTPELLLEL